jgi:hypothetical protein
MKPRIPSALAALALCTALAGCRSQPTSYPHWSNRSIGPRVSRQALGYDPTQDGDYLPYLEKDMDALGLTLRRHLLGDNPDNPLIGTK